MPVSFAPSHKQPAAALPKRAVAALGALALVGTTALAAAAPVAARPTGQVDGVGNRIILAASTTDTKSVELSYGRDDDEMFVGDWDGDGVDTYAVRRGNIFHVTDDPEGGIAATSFPYGRLGDTVLVGDWNGDGKDTFAVRRGNMLFLNNSLRGGRADIELSYGRVGDFMLVGDWDGDGRDSFGVRRGAQYLLRNAHTSGVADIEFHYGRAADETLVGDWNGDKVDTLGVRRGNVFMFTNGHRGGPADITTAFGRAADGALIGDWDGDGRDEMGVRRALGPVAFPLSGLTAYTCGDYATFNAATGTVAVVDCAEPHTFEVLERVKFSPAQVTHAAISTAANDACEAAFTRHTGKQPRIQHDISYTTVYPTPEQYHAGWRDAVCTVWQIEPVAGMHAVR